MKKFVIILLLIILCGASFFAYQYYNDRQKANSYSTEDSFVVAIGDIEEVVTAQGTLEPKEYVDVGAQISGLIKKMHFEIGDFVQTGDLIAEIDPDIYEASVREDEARLKTLNAQKQEQEANLKQAKLKYEREKTLLNSKATSKESFEDAENNFTVAQAKMLSIIAQIEERQSALERNKTNLSYTKIYSPMMGTIVVQAVNEGQTINANQTAPIIVQVAKLDVMTVKAQVAEADIMKIKLGSDMYFTTLGSNERRWYGKVKQVLPSPEVVNNVVLYNVLVDVNNQDNSLMVGMTTQMFFVLNSLKQVPIIPKSSLLKRLQSKDTQAGQAYTVKVLGDVNIVEEREIIVGGGDRINVSVIKGLKVGEKVLVGEAARRTGVAQGGNARRPVGMGRL